MASTIYLIHPSENETYVEIHRAPSSKPLKIRRAVRIGASTLMQGQNDKLYTYWREGEVSPYWLSSHRRWLWVYKAMVKMGLLDSVEADKFVETVVTEQLKSSRSYPCKNFLETAQEAGIRLNATQKARLESYRSPKKLSAKDVVNMRGAS